MPIGYSDGTYFEDEMEQALSFPITMNRKPYKRDDLHFFDPLAGPKAEAYMQDKSGQAEGDVDLTSKANQFEDRMNTGPIRQFVPNSRSEPMQEINPQDYIGIHQELKDLEKINGIRT